MSKDDEQQPAWIDRVVKVAGALGMNPVRVRWKLIRWVDGRRAAARRREQAVSHVKYEHAVCPSCGAVNARDEAACTRCGTALRSRPREVLGRLGIPAPSPTIIVALAIVACYVRIALAGHDWMTISASTLAVHGANLPAGAAPGEPWRYLTSTLLHVGMWHLGFNLLALAILGPATERAYGRLAMPFVFVLTGVLASIASQETGLDAVAAGASGALMGLTGAVAIAGHKSGTTIGRAERNAMLRWAAYTVVFGFVIGADNRAHVGGVLAGVLFGLAVPVGVRARRAARIVFGVLGALSLAAIAGAVVLVMAPPDSATASIGDDSTSWVIQAYAQCKIGQRIEDAGGTADDGSCEQIDALRRACAMRVPDAFDSARRRTECEMLRQLDQSIAAPPDESR